MLIGVIADDFTGASDIANTLAKGVEPEGGLSTAQFSGIPKKPAPDNIDAGVISLKSRSAPVEEAIQESCAALDWLLAQGCRQILFKYCSTFDSTSEGNIGPVGEALAEKLNDNAVVVCPAFPTAGRTVYQGHLFVFDKLLNESGMEHHPLTPMTDPDIRRWLGMQCKGTVGHVDKMIVDKGVAAVKSALHTSATSGHRFCVVDATTDSDLLTIGEAVANAPLVTGGSGVATGLPRNFIRSGHAQSRQSTIKPVTGSAAILVGSCSAATRGQIEEHALNHPTFSIDVSKVMSDETGPEQLLEFFNTHSDTYPLVYSSGSPDAVSAIQNQYGREIVSEKLDRLFADTAYRLLDQGYKRLVVAGGETSGAVAQAVADSLNAEAMLIGPEIDPGVPVLQVGNDEPIALALKSGNFGSRDFFTKALAVMQGNR